MARPYPSRGTPRKSEYNSVEAPMIGGTVWTGIVEDVSEHASITVSVATDQPGMMYTEFSQDGVTWDVSNAHAIEAGVPYVTHIAVDGQYYRCRLDNTGSDQTYLRMRSMLRGTLAAAAAEGGNNYTFIDASGDHLIKSGEGTLIAIIDGDPTALATCKIWDSLTATGGVIADLVQPLGLAAAYRQLDFGVAFTTGLVVTVGAGAKLTVIWK